MRLSIIEFIDCFRTHRILHKVLDIHYRYTIFDTTIFSYYISIRIHESRSIEKLWTFAAYFQAHWIS